MRRLYLLLPSLESCESLVGELEASGIPERHLHVVASISQDLHGLPEAGVLQKTEILRGVALGAVLGGVGGMLGGWLAMTFPPAGLVLGTPAVVISTLAGAGLGALTSALMSSHEHNHKLDAFEGAIERGEILLLLDVPRDQVPEIRNRILEHHPEADIRETAPPRR